MVSLKQYGLIGYPLQHSFSPAYFSEKFAKENVTNACYESFPLPHIDMFPQLLGLHPHLSGLNVTLPYKEAIIPFLNALDPVAQIVGAVNCIDISNGKTTGYNTDVAGFEKSLRPLLKKGHRYALVLGTGGASRAIMYVLNSLGIYYKKVSRTEKEDTYAYSQVTEEVIAAHTLIINTTPMGMYPHVEQCPDIPYAALGEKHLLYDLVYNPKETLFLKKGKEHGAAVKNGLEMLHIQAEESWDIWNR